MATYDVKHPASRRLSQSMINGETSQQRRRQSDVNDIVFQSASTPALHDVIATKHVKNSDGRASIGSRYSDVNRTNLNSSRKASTNSSVSSQTFRGERNVDNATTNRNRRDKKRDVTFSSSSTRSSKDGAGRNSLLQKQNKSVAFAGSKDSVLSSDEWLDSASRPSSQRSLNRTTTDDDDVISNHSGSQVPASLEKLPTNVFLDNYLERDDETGDDDQNNLYDDDDDDERGDVSGEGRTVPPSQRKGGAKLAAPEREEDAETVLDISSIIEKRPSGYDDTGQTAYINACRKFKALPCGVFYRNLQNSTHIDLSNYSLGFRESMAICIPLVINNRVTSVDLSTNGLSEESVKFIGKMMAANDCITHLNLSENNLRTHGAKVVARMLQDNTCLQVLDISKNHFSCSDAAYLTEPLQVHPTIRDLNLGHNDFGEKSSQLFQSMISENGTLEELDLSWCQFRGKGAVNIAKGVKENIGLKKLNLAWNGFGEEGAIALAVASRHCTLTRLDVTNNRIGSEGYGCLVKSLRDNEYLKELILAKNPIPEDSAIAGLEFIVTKMDDLKLELLSFEDIIYSDAFRLKQEEVINKFSNVVITWGYTDMYGKRRMKEYNMVEEAMRSIGKYCDEHGIKIVDLFARFDTDDSMSVSHEEFAQGLREAKVPISKEQITELIRTLDEDGDGEIDFSEMVLGTEMYYKPEVD